jgi:hypothetical protein
VRSALLPLTAAWGAPGFIPNEQAALADQPSCAPGARIRLDTYVCFGEDQRYVSIG